MNDLITTLQVNLKDQLKNSVDIGWDGKIGDYMLVNEMGFEGPDKNGRKMNIPARPALRKTTEKESVWRLIEKNIVKNLLNGKSMTLIVAEIGASLKGDLQQNIIRWAQPPNKPSTVKKKGFNNPLMGGKNGKTHATKSTTALHSVKVWVNKQEVSFSND